MRRHEEGSIGLTGLVPPTAQLHDEQATGGSWSRPLALLRVILDGDNDADVAEQLVRTVEGLCADSRSSARRRIDPLQRYMQVLVEQLGDAPLTEAARLPVLLTLRHLVELCLVQEQQRSTESAIKRCGRSLQVWPIALQQAARSPATLARPLLQA